MSAKAGIRSGGMFPPESSELFRNPISPAANDPGAQGRRDASSRKAANRRTRTVVIAGQGYRRRLGPVTLRRVVARIVLLSDRLPDEVLPAVGGLLLDLKTEPLSVDSLLHVRELAPEAILVDAAENPGQAHAILRTLDALQVRAPVIVVVGRAELDRFPWADLGDDFLYPGAPEAEIRLRLALLRRRAGTGEGSTVRLGPIALDLDSYQGTLLLVTHDRHMLEVVRTTRHLEVDGGKVTDLG